VGAGAGFEPATFRL